MNWGSIANLKKGRKPMRFDFNVCKQSDLEDYLHHYAASLSSPIDSFLEERILHSSFYEISYNANKVGYFAVNSNYCLTQFYLDMFHYKHSQEIFKQIITEYSIKSILVPTCDEFLLSLVLDYDFKVEKQAYLFQDNKEHIITDKLYQDGQFQYAVLEDVKQIEMVCSEFIDRVEERIAKGEIFTFYKEDTLLGVGIAEQSKLLPGYVSIGMFTNAQYRQKGIGRTIIHHLKEWSYKNSLNPISGCWYYNTLSKLTLESAGMVTKTRLLNIKVV